MKLKLKLGENIEIPVELPLICEIALFKVENEDYLRKNKYEYFKDKNGNIYVTFNTVYRDKELLKKV